MLAGDWTATGLPATIEGAIRSGNKAAQTVRKKQYGTSSDYDRNTRHRHVVGTASHAGGAPLDAHIEAATKALLNRQRQDGHWVFELEADATIPAEYVLLRHYLGEPVDAQLEAKIAAYLRRIQGAHGGWPLFHDGEFDMSASVKAYFALKMIGDAPEAAHMRRAREAILAHGGAAGSNVFTRKLLALYGVVPWRAVPVMPVEIMLLPRWFPFHLSKISYWARTVIVPLLVLQCLKPKARNAKGVRIDELFSRPPHTVGAPSKAPHQKWFWFLLFRGIDHGILRIAEPWMPPAPRGAPSKRRSHSSVSVSMARTAWAPFSPRWPTA